MRIKTTMKLFLAALMATLLCCQADNTKQDCFDTGDGIICTDSREIDTQSYENDDDDDESSSSSSSSSSSDVTASGEEACMDTCGPHGDKSLICHYPPGNTSNMQTICVGSKLVPDHLEHGDSCGECELPEPECGDNTCSAPEDCSNCSEDCGTCTPVCGDQVCEDAENCSLCADDCGSCPPVCGDEGCEEGETCEECAYDCGVCSPVCGDASCDEGESCENCEADCGECSWCEPECGNQTCEDGESCSNCPGDCGECEPVCGDSYCESGEDCATCPTDCGLCPPDCGNEVCEVGENCSACAVDCGNCPPSCDDGVCDNGESCESCPTDCGGCMSEEPSKDAGVSPEITVTGGELGGCSTSGTSNGASFILMFGAALYLMRKKKSVTTLVMLFLLMLPTAAVAQVVGDPGTFKLERFEMAMDGHSIITVEGAEVNPKGSSGLHFSLGYADDPLVLQENTGDGFKRVGSLVGHQLSAEVGGYLALTDRFAVGLSFPMVLSQDRDAGSITGLPTLSSGDVGDPRLLVKYQLDEQDGDNVNVAIGAVATIPRELSESDYLGGNSATLTPYLAASERIGSWRWAANMGVKIQENSKIVDLEVTDEAFVRLGLAKSWDVNEIGVSLTGTSSARDMFSNNTSYSEAMASYSRRYDNGLSSFVGTGIGLNEGFGSPDWRVFLGMRLDLEAAVATVQKVVPPVVTETIPEPPPEIVPEMHKILTIPDTFFAFDKAEVLSQYSTKLKMLAEELSKLDNENPEYGVFLVVQGHTDSIGSVNYNLDLGERRAKAVVGMLVKFGFPADKVWAITFGESKPAASNTTEEGRATNRRIVIQFGTKGDLPENFKFVLPDDKPDDKTTYDTFGNLKVK